MNTDRMWQRNGILFLERDCLGSKELEDLESSPEPMRHPGSGRHLLFLQPQEIIKGFGGAGGPRGSLFNYIKFL